MSCNPCPCMDLRKGVLILACLDILFNAVLVILALYGIYLFANVVSAVAIAISTLVLIYAIIQLILAATLLSGANKRKSRKCLVWLRCTIFFTIVNAIVCVLAFVYVKTSYPSWCSLIRLVYAIYEMKVVASFLYEIKSNGAAPGPQEDVEKVVSAPRPSIDQKMTTITDLPLSSPSSTIPEPEKPSAPKK